MGDGLRKWQREALETYLAAKVDGRKSILWEATPGAGKTFAAMHVCRRELKAKQAKRIIVVVPTTHLKLQWAYAAAELGIALDTNYTEKRRRLAQDFHGAVLSYQQIGNCPRNFRALATNAIVVLDEVHHAGDGLTWGESLKLALADSSFILCLSGTAFRSDNNPIPFVKYTSDLESDPDYCYGYSAAVSDRVCRPTVFFTYGGEVAWRDGELEAKASFSDAIDRVGRTKRLRAALDPESGWIEPMLREADEMLSAVRAEHPGAGGLLVASSQRNARALAKILRQITCEAPTVVLSEDPVANRKLRDFTEGTQRWLVACNMVSEGVDVPRLRIGVFATTVRTKMYFRQFLGRIVRKTKVPKGVQTAFFYLPADPWLKRLAEEIEEEQRHSITASQIDDWSDLEVGDREVKEEKNESWQALQSTNSGLESVISGGGQLALWGKGGEESSLSALNSVELEPIAPDRSLTKTELKEEIARDIRNLVSRYRRKSGRPYSYIHGILNQKQGLKSQHECTEAQLRERVMILERLIE